ncbi:MAG: methyltransferase domain-containing protein [Leptospiraceae bacterium]|nr:methyltransferase domain-containing protein [Leptospiraceae bacterium]
MEESKPYQTFSLIYDSVMAHIHFEDWAEFILTSLPYTPKSVLDLACGTGTLLGEFLEIPEKVGLDRSEEMIRVGKTKFPFIEFTLNDLRKFNLNRKFDLITCTHDSINYLNDMYELEDHFRSVYKHLEINGYYFFDISSEFNLEKNFNNKTFKEKHGEFSLIWKNFYDPLKRKIISTLEFERIENEEKKKFLETHVQKFFSNTEILTVAKKSGLELVKIGSDYKNWSNKNNSSLINYLFIKN